MPGRCPRPANEPAWTVASPNPPRAGELNPVAGAGPAGPWTMRAGGWREWFFAVLLYAPVLIPYAAHHLPRDGDERIPTGFVQYDQPYYMANARQYLDGATDGLRYASPFSACHE